MNELDLRAALLRVAVRRSGPVAPSSETWFHWITAARLQRGAPLLYRLIETVPTNLTDAQRAEAFALHGSVLLRCVELEHHLLAVNRLLVDHGLRSAVLKGGATAHLDYPDPSWREVNDIDLLVEPGDLTATTTLLAPAGWVQGYALPGGHEQFTHAVTLVRDRMELDLHQRIARRALGLRVATRELLENAMSFEVAGSQLLALNDLDRLIHSALHMIAARGLGRRLSSVADVLIAADGRANLAREVLARAEHWRVRPLLEAGVREAYGMAQLDLHPAWAEAMRRPIRRRDRLVEAAYLSEFRRPLVMELAYLRLLKGWSSRWRYTAGYFTTDPDYVERHGRSGIRAQARYVRSKLRPP